MQALIQSGTKLLFGKPIRRLRASRDALLYEIERNRLELGRVQSLLLRTSGCSSHIDAEFSIFSQWGEDGIMQWLLQHTAIKNKTFVEIGVQDYRESNTRFLLMKDNWKGLIIDSGRAHIDYLRQHRDLMWKYDITPKSAFVNQSNVNAVIEESGFEGEIGLLSIDIDGNDYWVLKAISAVNPSIIIIEYNSLFGPDAAVTVPYRDDFDRTKAHYSNLYFGASISALTDLASSKGYALAGSTSAGNNLFFVKRDIIDQIPILSPQECYVRSRDRQSRDISGNLTYIGDHKELLRIISDMIVYDVRNECDISISQLFTPAHR